MSELLTLVILIGALLWMVRSARGDAGAATRWRDLRGYDLEGKMWAVALLAGLALGEIAQGMGVRGTGFMPFALVLGVVCGWPRRPTRFSTLVPGLVGVVASIIGSASFVAAAPDSADRTVRISIMLALALMSALGILVRAQPLGGLTWFAALEVVVFLSGPAGLSWAQIGELSTLIPVILSIGIAVALALAPEFVISLAALGVALTHLIVSGTGMLPGDFGQDVAPLAATMLGYFIMRAVRRRLG